MDVGRRVYFVSEVAEILGVSRQTVLKYIKSGLVPGIRVGGRYLIMKDAFEEFLRSGGNRPAGVEEDQEAVTEDAKTSLEGDR